MDKKKKYFGTDGVRGAVNCQPITPQFAQALGAAVVDWYKNHRSCPNKPQLGIGTDTRQSCDMLAAAIASGSASMGGDVALLGILPTPAVAWWTRQQANGIGIVISASHNHSKDNGIKLFASDGYKLSDDDELAIEQRIDLWLERELPLPDYKQIGKISHQPEVSNNYSQYLTLLWPTHLDLSTYKIAIDAANGAAYAIAPQLFRTLGAEVIEIATTPDGFNINEKCGATDIKALAQFVIEQSADIGLAFDGDADRLIAIDETGKSIDGDQIMAICAPRMMQRNALTDKLVVATVMSNLGLEQTLAKHGIKLLRTGVGDRYVIEQMRQCQANLGGEQSGHLIFSEYATTGDGILAAIQLLQILVAEQTSASALAAEMKHLPQILHNVPVREKLPWQDIPPLRQIVEQTQRDLAENGRILVRYSGTENRVRIMLEGQNLEHIKQLASKIVAAFELHLGS
jgi:phosphoglucosamine mutase